MVYCADSNLSQRNEQQGHCIWYDECAYSKLANKAINCYYNGTAKPLDAEGQHLLSKYCSYMLVDRGNGINTCCNTANLRSLNDGLQLAANFLSRCPSCMDNFARQICEMTCSPNQSQFLEPVQIKINETTGLFFYIPVRRLLHSNCYYYCL